MPRTCICGAPFYDKAGKPQSCLVKGECDHSRIVSFAGDGDKPGTFVSGWNCHGCGLHGKGPVPDRAELKRIETEMAESVAAYAKAGR